MACLLFITMPALTTGQITFPIGDDGFASAACCTPVTPNIPIVTGATLLGTQDGQYGVFSDCSVSLDARVKVETWLFPHPGGIPPQGVPGQPPVSGLPACDELVVQVLVRDPVTPANIFTTIGPAPTSPAKRENFILAKFVRTRTGLGPNGMDQYRFWDYMIEGDAVSFSATPNIPASAIPPCYSNAVPAPPDTFDRVCLRGYLVIMQNLNTHKTPKSGEFEYTLVMSHYDGCLDHLVTPLNDREIPSSAASKHVGQSFHLVTPDQFSWLANQPTQSQLALSGVNFDALRSTVTHQIPSAMIAGPLCLAESPIYALLDPNVLTCNCTSGMTGAAIDYNQSFPDPGSTTTCGSNISWHSFFLIPEIPTGFTQTYLGQWSGAARADVSLVQTLLNIGTIECRDECAWSRGYYNNIAHITWGNALLWPDSGANNLPKPGAGNMTTDYLLHFGNHVDDGDANIAGTPGYANLVWTLYR